MTKDWKREKEREREEGRKEQREGREGGREEEVKDRIPMVHKYHLQIYIIVNLKSASWKDTHTTLCITALLTISKI